MVFLIIWIMRTFTGRAGKIYLWKLYVAPRANFFMWLFLNGKFKTLGFLNSLNILSNPYYVLCGMHREDINHLFNQCFKTHIVWRKIEESTNINLNFSRYINYGIWLENAFVPKTKWVASPIVATVRIIWRARCSFIFKGLQLNRDWIAISLQEMKHLVAGFRSFAGSYTCR